MITNEFENGPKGGDIPRRDKMDVNDSEGGRWKDEGDGNDKARDNNMVGDLGSDVVKILGEKNGAPASR